MASWRPHGGAMSETNDYMEEVMAKQQRVAVDLRAKRAMPAANRMPQAMMQNAIAPVQQQIQAEDTGRFRREAPASIEAPPAASVEVRITGWWRWKTVIVPPNAHVV